MFSKLTGASFPKQRTIYSTDCYSHFLELKAQNAFISLPQRKASFGRFESSPPSQLTSTSHLEGVISSRVGTCCFLTPNFPAEAEQAGFTSSPCHPRRRGSSWKVRVVSPSNTPTAFYKFGTRCNLCLFI